MKTTLLFYFKGASTLNLNASIQRSEVLRILGLQALGIPVIIDILWQYGIALCWPQIIVEDFYF